MGRTLTRVSTPQSVATACQSPPPQAFLANNSWGRCTLPWPECPFGVKYPSLHQDLAPPNCQQAPVLDTTCQTTSKTGTHPHPSTDRLPKVVLSSQTLQNTLFDTALPIRVKRFSSTNQRTGASPSHQETYTSSWTNLTHQGSGNRSKGTMNLQQAERRPQTQ